MNDFVKILLQSPDEEKVLLEKPESPPRQIGKMEMIRILKDFAKEHRIDVKELVLSSGGGMLMHGLRDSVTDVDVGVSRETFAMMTRFGYSVSILQYDGYTKRRMEIGDVDLIEDHVPLPREDTTVIQGLRVFTLDALLRQKKELAALLGRDKDHRDVATIEKAIHSRK